MKLYAISGLGADERVFQGLEVGQKIVHLPWKKPLKGEHLAEYAGRMGEGLDFSGPFAFMGVSFGGMVALEMSKHFRPQATLLISTVETHHEIPGIYRFIGKLGMLKWVPADWMKPPSGLLSWLFGAKNKRLLREILHDSDPGFTKWAILELMSWKNVEKASQTYRIHGNKDRLFPVHRHYSGSMVEGGGHFMIVDKSAEISTWIREIVSSIKGRMGEESNFSL